MKGLLTMMNKVETTIYPDSVCCDRLLFLRVNRPMTWCWYFFFFSYCFGSHLRVLYVPRCENDWIVKDYGIDER